MVRRVRRVRWIALAGQEGLEPPTTGFGDRDSGQLSYCPGLPNTASANTHRYPRARCRGDRTAVGPCSVRLNRPSVEPPGPPGVPRESRRGAKGPRGQRDGTTRLAGTRAAAGSADAETARSAGTRGTAGSAGREGPRVRGPPAPPGGTGDWVPPYRGDRGGRPPGIKSTHVNQSFRTRLRYLRIRHAGRGRQGQGAQGGGQAGHRLRRRRAGLPDP